MVRNDFQFCNFNCSFRPLHRFSSSSSIWSSSLDYPSIPPKEWFPSLATYLSTSTDHLVVILNCHRQRDRFECCKQTPNFVGIKLPKNNKNLAETLRKANQINANEMQFLSLCWQKRDFRLFWLYCRLFMRNKNKYSTKVFHALNQMAFSLSRFSIFPGLFHISFAFQNHCIVITHDWH